MNTKNIYIIIATMALSISTFNANASGIYPGEVLNEVNRAETNIIVKNMNQMRYAYGYIDAADGKLVGGAENKFVVRGGPQNTVLAYTSGRVNLSFTPAETQCISEFSLTLTIGNTIPFSLNPSCNKLLIDGVKRSLSYTIAEVNVVVPEMTIDPFGLLKVKANMNAVLLVGADFEAGLEVGGFIGASEPIYVDGKRSADYIFASVKPFISGGAKAEASAYLNLVIKSLSVRIAGALTLIEAETKVMLQGGVAYKPDSSGDFQYFAGLNWKASAKGGYGSVKMYIHIKLFDFWTIYWSENTLINIDPIIDVNGTIFDKVVYF